MKTRKQRKTEAVIALVEAIDAYFDLNNEVDTEERNRLWREMATANEKVAELFNLNE